MPYAILRPMIPRAPRRKDLLGEHLSRQSQLSGEAGHGRDQRRARTASITMAAIGGARILPEDD